MSSYMWDSVAVSIEEWEAMEIGSHFRDGIVAEGFRDIETNQFILVLRMKMPDVVMCTECEINVADLPSSICVGCDAYREHLQ